MRTLIVISLLAFPLLADEQKADPIPDRMRFEIAIAQRDYVIAKAQLEEAARRVQEKVEAAQRLCKDETFSANSFSCVPKEQAAKK